MTLLTHVWEQILFLFEILDILGGLFGFAIWVFRKGKKLSDEHKKPTEKDQARNGDPDPEPDASDVRDDKAD